MKLLPFNLERALAGDKVVTRDGREVEQLVKFDFIADPLVGVVNNKLMRWRDCGSYYENDSDARDLFMAPKTVKWWVNITSDSIAYVFNDEIEARKDGRGTKCIAIAVPVEFEEGYGLDE